MNKIIRDITIAASIALVIRRFIEPTTVVGNSMFPELHDGDKLILDKTAYDDHDPEAGDVVVFATPSQRSKLLIKRIIGVPGDHIVIHDGHLYINDEEGNDDFTAEGATNGDVDMKVPDGRYFCMGDNRLHSRDSRDAMVGCIPRDSIRGKVSIRVYPPGKVYSREVVEREEDAGEDVL